MYCPTGYKYLHNHLWFQSVGKQDILIGVTDFIQKEIGRIELIEVEKEGAFIAKNKVFAKLFGNNNVFELIMPVSGKILTINNAVIENPGIINIDPYQNWVIIISSDLILEDSAIEYLSSENYEKIVLVSGYKTTPKQEFSLWTNKN